MSLYIHKPSGEYLRLLKLRASNINTYLQVDSNNKPIIEKRDWSVRPETQILIITGFEDLEKIS
jgi:hypothetical protein